MTINTKVINVSNEPFECHECPIKFLNLHDFNTIYLHVNI